MFGSSNGNDPKNKNKKVPRENINSQSTNSLVRGTSVEGTITTESDIRIDGKLVGHLISKGKVIIGDAMFCQRDICREIVDFDGDYFFTVKENQPTLLKNIQLAFAETEGFSPLPTS